MFMYVGTEVNNDNIHVISFFYEFHCCKVKKLLLKHWNPHSFPLIYMLSGNTAEHSCTTGRRHIIGVAQLHLFLGG